MTIAITPIATVPAEMSKRDDRTYESPLRFLQHVAHCQHDDRDSHEMAITPSTGRALPTGARSFSIAAPSPPNARALLAQARSVLPVALCGAPPSAKSVTTEPLPSTESGKRESQESDHSDTDSEDQGLMVAWEGLARRRWRARFRPGREGHRGKPGPERDQWEPNESTAPCTRNAGNSSMTASPEADQSKRCADPGEKGPLVRIEQAGSGSPGALPGIPPLFPPGRSGFPPGSSGPTDVGCHATRPAPRTRFASGLILLRRGHTPQWRGATLPVPVRARMTGTRCLDGGSDLDRFARID